MESCRKHVSAQLAFRISEARKSQVLGIICLYKKEHKIVVPNVQYLRFIWSKIQNQFVGYFPKNEHFLLPDTHKNIFYERSLNKIWRRVFSLKQIESSNRKVMCTLTHVKNIEP